MVHVCAYILIVQFEWDPAKAASNFLKHRIRFADAATVLDDDAAITVHERHFNENRFITIGMDAESRILVVVYAWRGEKVRLISARKATSRERLQYGTGI